MRLDSLDIRKGGGSVTGAAFVGWDGDYSFNADGERIPVESLQMANFPQAPLSGVLQFDATGAGTFDEPRYDVKLRADDLFAGDEGIGQLNGRLSLRGELLTIEMEAASPRLVVSGSGRIALTPEMDAELTVRFADTSLDPYVRFFEPRLSPFTNAVAGGTIRVVGELANVDHLVVETHVESLDLKLFDYRLHNKGPIDLSLDQHVLKVGQLALTGEGTELQVDGQIAFDSNEISVAGRGRRQPRHPAGLLSGPAQPRHGGDQGADQRAARQAGVFGQRRHHRRAHPRAVDAELDRGHQRAHLVRRRRRPPERRGGAAR